VRRTHVCPYARSGLADTMTATAIAVTTRAFRAERSMGETIAVGEGVAEGPCRCAAHEGTFSGQALEGGRSDSSRRSGARVIIAVSADPSRRKLPRGEPDGRRAHLRRGGRPGGGVGTLVTRRRSRRMRSITEASSISPINRSVSEDNLTAAIAASRRPRLHRWLVPGPDRLTSDAKFVSPCGHSLPTVIVYFR
jgi:hypothetical protein